MSPRLIVPGFRHRATPHRASAPSTFARFAGLFGYRLPPPSSLAVCLNQAGRMRGGPADGRHLTVPVVPATDKRLQSHGRGDVSARKRSCATGTDVAWLRSYWRTEGKALNHQDPAPRPHLCIFENSAGARARAPFCSILLAIGLLFWKVGSFREFVRGNWSW